MTAFLKEAKVWWKDEPGFDQSKGVAEAAFNILRIAERDLRRPYDDDAAQQAALRQLTTVLHHRYILAVRFDESDELYFGREYAREVTILKCLMRFYVFCNPMLLRQQNGHRKIVGDLFNYFFDRSPNALPTRVRELFDEDDNPNLEARAARAAADTVAGMTELEALAMHRAVTGTDSGRIRGRIVS